VRRDRGHHALTPANDSTGPHGSGTGCPSFAKVTRLAQGAYRRGPRLRPSL